MYNSDFFTEAARVEPNWASLGLLDGIDDKYVRACSAVLLENQMLAEAATDSSDIAQFQKVAIPLVRRIYPQLIANKIVSVQPLLGPAGLVYYLRFRYSSDKGSMRGGNNTGFPSDDAASMQQRASGDANLNIYYSSSIIQNETSSTDNGADTTSVFSPLEYTPVIAGSMTGSVYDDTTLVQTFTVSEAGTFTFVDVGTPSPKCTAGTLDTTTGEMTLTWNSAPGDNHVVVSYEYNMECNQNLPEVSLTVENETIEAKRRTLKAVWSWETQQDLRSQHNLDAEAELTSVLAQEINLEIDREIINDLRTNAGTVASWDYAAALGTNIKEKYESLYVKLMEVSATIHRKTLRSGANFVVCSPEVAAMFETATAGFAPSPSETFTSTLGVQYVGTVNSRFKLYKDPTATSTQLLMGYKGDSYMDSGYFYCPYVPLTQTPVIYDPESTCPRKGLMTRYGKKMLREGAKFYARVNVVNWSS